VNYRRGLSRTFTVESNAEATPGAAMVGAGGVIKVGTLGIVNASAAGSTGNGLAGEQFSLGAQRLGSLFSLGASA